MKRQAQHFADRMPKQRLGSELSFKQPDPTSVVSLEEVPLTKL